jgi:endonuclease YncB( thermonuclease family)
MGAVVRFRQSGRGRQPTVGYRRARGQRRSRTPSGNVSLKFFKVTPILVLVSSVLVGAWLHVGLSVPSVAIAESQATGKGFLTAVAHLRGVEICRGGNRRARKVTCLVDGDTGWENGVKWRLDSVDTPELGRPACRNERRAGIAARDRLRDLMSGGYQIEWMGRSGTYRRKLVRIRLADGRYAGRVLIREGLAQPWPNSGNIWCNF